MKFTVDVISYHPRETFYSSYKFPTREKAQEWLDIVLKFRVRWDIEYVLTQELSRVMNFGESHV